MKNNKKLFIYSGIGLCVLILIIVLFLYNKNNTNETNENKIPITKVDEDTVKKLEISEVNVYYLDTLANTLVSEKRQFVDKSKEEGIDWEIEKVNQIFNFMKENSKVTTNIVSVVPDNLDILKLELIEDKTLKADFSRAYYKMEEAEEILFRSAFVWSVTELGAVENVEISIEEYPLKKGDGQPMGKLNRNNIVLNPSISPEKTKMQNVILYFSDSEEEGLVTEERLIEVKQSQSLENQIVEQLILGPKEKDHFATIPAETKIRNIKTEGGICYVDLSSEFVTKHTGGSSGEIFTIYSIVNSLTELEEVNKVQFLIDGEKVNVYKGNLDISKPLDRKEINSQTLGDL